MSSKNYRNVLILLILVLLGGVIYFSVSRKSQTSTTNKPEAGISPMSEPAAIDKEQGVFVSTDKTRYVLGEKVSVTIKNNTDKTIWLADTCGTPFSILKKNGSDWDIRGAYEGFVIRCISSQIPKIESGAKIGYVLDLKSIYSHKTFSIEPGRYKFEIQYTGTDLSVFRGDFVYLKSFSDEFFIVAK